MEPDLLPSFPPSVAILLTGTFPTTFLSPCTTRPALMIRLSLILGLGLPADDIAASSSAFAFSFCTAARRRAEKRVASARGEDRVEMMLSCPVIVVPALRVRVVASGSSSSSSVVQEKAVLSSAFSVYAGGASMVGDGDGDGRVADAARSARTFCHVWERESILEAGYDCRSMLVADAIVTAYVTSCSTLRRAGIVGTGRYERGIGWVLGDRQDNAELHEATENCLDIEDEKQSKRE